MCIHVASPMSVSMCAVSNEHSPELKHKPPKSVAYAFYLGGAGDMLLILIEQRL
jgi:hypothetical protein